jgi:hypothetical protein
MSAYLSIRCACGATTRASSLLAGGPIPCIDCGRANQHRIKSKARGATKRHKTGPTKRPLAARGLAERPHKRRDLGSARYKQSLVALAIGLAVASSGAFVLQAMGPEPMGAAWFIMGTLFVTGLDIGVIAVGAYVLGISVGTLVETGFKVALIAQVMSILASGAVLVGGAAPLFACGVMLLAVPALVVNLFGWNWGEALMIFLGQIVCHVGVSYSLASLIAQG